MVFSISASHRRKHLNPRHDDTAFEISRWKKEDVEQIHSDIRKLLHDCETLDEDRWPSSQKEVLNLAAEACTKYGQPISVCHTRGAYNAACQRIVEQHDTDTRPEIKTLENTSHTSCAQSNPPSTADLFDALSKEPTFPVELFQDALALPVGERPVHGGDEGGYYSDTEFLVRTARPDSHTGSTAESP